MTPSTAFAKFISMKQGEKNAKKWSPNTYVIVCAKEKDALNIFLSNGINCANVYTPL